MSRTNRRKPHKRGNSPSVLQLVIIYGDYGAHRANGFKKKHGRDGYLSKPLRDATVECDRGFYGWAEHNGPLGKATAKKDAAKARRRRGKNIVKRELIDLGDGR
jgi:hypothetical protein